MQKNQKPRGSKEAPKDQLIGTDLINCLKDLLDKKIQAKDVKAIYLLNFKKSLDINNSVKHLTNAVTPRICRMHFTSPVARIREYVLEHPEDDLARLFTEHRSTRAFLDHPSNKVIAELEKLVRHGKIQKVAGRFKEPETNWITTLEEIELPQHVAA